MKRAMEINGLHIEAEYSDRALESIEKIKVTYHEESLL